MKKYLGFLFIFSCNAHAVPVNIQSCINNGACFLGDISNVSTINGNLITSYDFFDIRSGSIQQKTLTEYQLGSASVIDDVDEHGQLTQTSITGSIWLEVQQQYSLSDSLHSLSLHFDETTPPTILDVFGSFPTAENELHMQISTEGLLSGQGASRVEIDPILADEPYSLFSSEGNRPLPCLAEGCFVEATLNLLTLQYLNFGDSINLVTPHPNHQEETRELLFKTGTGYYSNYYKTYSLAPVPLPPSLLLFISGGVLLLFRLRSKNASL